MLTLINDLGTALASRATIQSPPGSDEPTMLRGVGIDIAGIPISESNALTLSPVYRAVSAITGSLMIVPWRVVEDSGEQTKIQADHPVTHLLHREPNEFTTPAVFRETLTSAALLWGNGYAEIVRDLGGRARALYPIASWRVEPRLESGRLLYRVQQPSRGSIDLEPRDVLHIRNLGDGLQGFSVIRLARMSLSLTAAAEAHGASFFGNGARPGGVLEHPNELSDPARENIRTSWEAMHGGPTKVGKVAILEEGMKYTPLTMPMDDAQFLQTREFQVAEIGRWFHVPPHKMGDYRRMTFNNIEHARSQYVEDAVTPWAVRLEQEANRKLLGGPSDAGLTTKLNLNGLMRGDSKQRGEFYRLLWDRGAMTANEMLALEDMDQVGDQGDVRFVPRAMMPIAEAMANEGADNDADRNR